MKMIYNSFSDWAQVPKKALIGLVLNFVRLICSVAVGLISIFAALYGWGKSHTKIVLITLLVITAAGWKVSHMQMKAQLTTVEHHRDSLQMKMDSIMEFQGKTSYAYSRIIK